MNTLNRKLLLLILSVFLSQTSTTSFATEGGNAGGGGGVVNQNGRLVTFGSAGFYVGRVPLTTSEIDGLQELQRLFQTNKFLFPQTRSVLLRSLMPAANRIYYKVDKNTFTPAVRTRLIKEFANVIHADPSNLTIAAVTNSFTGETFLFPEFFDLQKVSEKMAILYHENYWMMSPDASYEEVIRSEIAFQGFVENQNSAEKLLSWLQSINEKITHVPVSFAVVHASMRLDLANQSMGKLVKIKTLKGSSQISQAIFDLNVLKSTAAFAMNRSYNDAICELSASYGQSLFLQNLCQLAASRRLLLVFSDSQSRVNFNFSSLTSDSIFNGANCSDRQALVIGETSAASKWCYETSFSGAPGIIIYNRNWLNYEVSVR